MIDWNAVLTWQNLLASGIFIGLTIGMLLYVLWETRPRRRSSGLPRGLQALLEKATAEQEAMCDPPTNPSRCNRPMMGSRCIRVAGHIGPHNWPPPLRG